MRVYPVSLRRAGGENPICPLFLVSHPWHNSGTALSGAVFIGFPEILSRYKSTTYGENENNLQKRLHLEKQCSIFVVRCYTKQNEYGKNEKENDEPDTAETAR